MFTGTTLQASAYVACPQVLETRSDAIDCSIPAFELIKDGMIMGLQDFLSGTSHNFFTSSDFKNESPH